MSVIKELKQTIQGEVLDDPVSRRAYSVDASIYEVEPAAIVIPIDTHDLSAAIQIARHYQIPITPRGAATGITGGCLGSGIILDLSQHLNRIHEINLEHMYAICEPGVVQDRLNDALRPAGYRLGPDTSTGNRATLGGMLANNAAGSRALKYGRMIDHVEGIGLMLGSGEVLSIGPHTPADHPIVQQIWQVCAENQDEIRKQFPDIPRRASGYNLDRVIQGDPNLCPLIVGSEGTLGIVSTLKVRLSPLPKHTALCAVHFHDMIEGLSSVGLLLSLKPISLEMIDRDIITAGRHAPTLKNKLAWLQKDPAMVLVIEFEANDEKGLNAALEAMNALPIGYAKSMLRTSEEQQQVWQLRKAGLGLLLSKRGYSRAIAFIEDLAVAPEHLAPFIQEFLPYLRSKGKKAGIYGHAGSGCLHIRPYIDLRDPKECETMRQMLEDVTDLVLKYGGSLSGEHGDGLVRSWLNPRLYGETIYQAFKRVKEIFDPDHLFNPGKIVDAPPFLEHLRLSPETPIHEIATFLDFSKEGGFALSADLCNGNAECRKTEGIMCPSFQATGREYDTTRARAQALRGLIHGNHSLAQFSDQEILDVLDLCLQCKGCKSECPSQVDMAKMKAEFLHRSHKTHGLSLRDRLFGYIGDLQRLSSPLARLVNWAGASGAAKRAQNYLGVSPERSLPQLAVKRYSVWKAKQPRYKGAPVVLFNDTFNEFNCPEVGIAAVKVLQGMGYQVISPPWTCCGRPLISKGILDSAKKRAKKLVAALLPFAKQEIPIIGLEPSCLLAITDDFQGLLGYENRDLQMVIANCHTFDAFIASHQGEQLPFKRSEERVKLHGHCHQKALLGMSGALKVLSQVAKPSEIPSGCCGMAGSFGYEKEHYAISLQIGELALFPAVRETEEVIIADGFSCRSQIAHGTGREALHLAQYLAGCLENSRSA